MNLITQTLRRLQAGQWLVLRRGAFIVVGALLLLWTAALNGYPLIHADSGTYIWSSVIFIVPVDRPIGYSLFIRAASLFNSLWSVVAVQALGTGYLIFRSAELLLPPRPRRDLFAFGVLLAAILTTTVSVHVGLVLADLFASWIFLAGIVFVLSPHWYERIVAGFLLVLALLTHNSHVFIAAGVLLVMGAVVLIRRGWRMRYRGAVISLALLIGVSVLCALGINLYLRAGFAVTRGGDTFVVNRLVQEGILVRTLDTYCDKTKWTLCNYKEDIRAHPNSGGWFLWSPDSPLSQMGWEKSAAEHASILRYAAQCCLYSIVERNVAASWKQFWLVGSAAPVQRVTDDMNAALAIQKNYPNELAAFQNSAQQQQRKLYTRILQLDERVNTYLWLVLALALFVVAWRVRNTWLVATWCALFTLLVVNAIVVATVSGPSVRYQERVFWMVPFFVFVTAASLLLSALCARQKTVPNSSLSPVIQTNNHPLY